MRVVRNEAFIKQRTRFTQRGSLIGMALLLGSLLLSNKNPLVSWPLLIAGFVVAMAAVRVGNRYVRPPRRDLVLDKVLKGFDNRYVLYHYYQPAEHLLLTPSGLIVIHLQEQRGRIAVRGGRWRLASLAQRLRVLLGEAGLGNPARQLRHELAATEEMLAGFAGDKGDLPLESVIVFYASKVELDVADAEFPVLRAEDLKTTLRAMADAHPALPGRSHRALAAALEGKEPPEEPERPPEEARRKSSRSRKSKRPQGS